MTTVEVTFSEEFEAEIERLIVGKIVYALYGLTEEEIGIAEDAEAG